MKPYTIVNISQKIPELIKAEAIKTYQAKQVCVFRLPKIDHEQILELLISALDSFVRPPLLSPIYIVTTKPIIHSTYTFIKSLDEISELFSQKEQLSKTDTTKVNVYMSAIHDSDLDSSMAILNEYGRTHKNIYHQSQFAQYLESIKGGIK